MSKYIDSERLIAEIERRTYNAHEMPKANPDKKFYEGKDAAYSEIMLLIESLQQEQPMPDSTQFIEFWNEDKEMLKEKDFRDDAWRLAYNAFMCGFGRGFAIKRQEQPEVELEKEYNEQWGGYTHDGLSATIDRTEFEQIARHFYELARQKYEK